MTGAQTRLADHIATFYQAADRTSDGAMASHAYKQSVVELDDVIGRELVCVFRPQLSCVLLTRSSTTGRPVPHNDHGTSRKDECLLPHCERADRQEKQEGNTQY